MRIRGVRLLQGVRVHAIHLRSDVMSVRGEVDVMSVRREGDVECEG